MNIKEYVKNNKIKLHGPFALEYVLSGLVIQYGWNNILTTLDGVPSINLAQAIGINILVSFIVTGNEGNENDYDFVELLLKAFGKTIFTFILLWSVTLFL